MCDVKGWLLIVSVHYFFLYLSKDFQNSTNTNTKLKYVIPLSSDDLNFVQIMNHCITTLGFDSLNTEFKIVKLNYYSIRVGDVEGI